MQVEVEAATSAAAAVAEASTAAAMKAEEQTMRAAIGVVKGWTRRFSRRVSGGVSGEGEQNGSTHTLGTERDIQRLVDHMARHKGSGDPNDSSGSSGSSGSDSETSSSSNRSESDDESESAQQTGMPVRLGRRLSLTGDGDEQLFQEVNKECAAGGDASEQRKPSRRGSRFVEFWCVQPALGDLLFQ